MATPLRADWMQIGELARRSGVTPDCLRAWERRYGVLKPRRAAGNRRVYSSADEARARLMQRLIAQGRTASEAAEMALAARLTVDVGHGPAVDADEVAAVHEELRAALDRFEETTAQRLLERLLVAHSRLAVLRDVLLPYLRDVGDRWAEGHLNVAQEHFTSTFLEARFMAMARGWDRGLGPRALLACPSGERHVFGLVGFGIALHHLGWRITYLGADTPIAMVRFAAERLSPDLVVLSAVAPERFEAEHAQLRELTARWACALAGAGASAAASARAGARHLTGDPISAASDVG